MYTLRSQGFCPIYFSRCIVYSIIYEQSYKITWKLETLSTRVKISIVGRNGTANTRLLELLFLSINELRVFIFKLYARNLI